MGGRTIPTRRAILKLLGAAGVTGYTGTATADTCTTLELIGSVALNGAVELVGEFPYAYIAVRGTAPRRPGNMPEERPSARDDPGLSIVDWRTPERPEVVGHWTAPEEWHPHVQDVDVTGTIAGLSGDDGPGMLLVDVTDPENPSHLGTYYSGHTAHNFFLTDDYAFVQVDDADDPRMDIVDIRNPRTPESVGEYRLHEELPEFPRSRLNWLHDMYVQDDLAYMAWWDAGVIITDVSDPSHPTTLSHFGANPLARKSEADIEDIDEEYNLPPGNAHSIQPSPNGRFVYVGVETFPRIADVPDPGQGDYGGIKVYDVLDYEHPKLVTRIAPPSDSTTFRTAHNFDVTETRLYASWYSGGVRVYDIRDPTNPAEIGCFDPDDEIGYPWGGQGVTFWTAVADRGHILAPNVEKGVMIMKDAPQ